jgi:hypothetical protein
MGSAQIIKVFVTMASLCALSSPAAADPNADNGLLLSPDALSDILSVNLATTQWTLNSPEGPNETTPPECQIAGNATTTLVYGIDWANYQGASFSDGEGKAYRTVASQVAGVFANPKAASAVFDTLTKGLRACGQKTSVEHHPKSDMSWHNGVDNIGKASALWHSTLVDKPRWRCSVAARLKDKAVVEASVCQFVEPASAAQAKALGEKTDEVADQLAARAS